MHAAFYSAWRYIHIQMDICYENSPLYAIISGFEPDDVPGTSTFYDFISRIWRSDSNNYSSHIKLPKQKVKKPKLKGEKAAPIEKVTVDSQMSAFINSPVSTKQSFCVLFKVFE